LFFNKPSDFKVAITEIYPRIPGVEHNSGNTDLRNMQHLVPSE